MVFEISSAAFAGGAAIPSRYTCDGEDISPPLAWRGAPEGTRAFALICDDPDAPAGTWIHWVIYDIPATETGLAEATPRRETLASGARQGLNSWGRVGYNGACPPRSTHRYYFTLYALDAPTGLGPGVRRDDLLRALRSHILGEARLMGTYTRR